MRVEASVVIATRNRAAELAACLASLERQTDAGSFEIVVVDNGSEDGTADLLAAKSSPHLRSVFVPQPNRAKARNAGIAAAHGRIIIFCDDDTIAPQQFVAAHLRTHAETQPVVVSGPIVNVPDPQATVKPDARNYSRAYFCTCNASVAKVELDAVGGFDEQYELYGWEDTDLGIRLRARGLGRRFVWDAYIYHIKPPSAMTLDRLRAQASEKGAMAARFVRKTPSWPVRLATGAYAANFMRGAIVHAKPLRALYERAARGARPTSLVSTLAREALLDAAYLDALQTGLRRGG